MAKIMQQIRSKETRQWLMSTHFWGPAMNWSIPISTYLDAFQKGPEIISPNMTVALFLYSTMFMRFAWKVTPRNMLLFFCHCTNATAQITQAYRYSKYNSKQKS